MKKLGSWVSAVAAAGALLSCSSATEGKHNGLLLLPQGPGLASSNAALGVPFLMVATVFSLPSGSCGSGACPPGSEHVTVTAASCGAGECTVILTPDSQTFEVQPTRAGMVRVHAQAQAQRPADDRAVPRGHAHRGSDRPTWGRRRTTRRAAMTTACWS